MEGQGEFRSDLLEMIVVALSREQARRMGLKGGVAIMGVHIDGVAVRGGLELGDVIIKINNESIMDIEDFKRVVSELQRGQKVRIMVLRGNERLIPTFRIP